MSDASIEPGIFTIISFGWQSEMLVPTGRNFLVFGSKALDKEVRCRPCLSKSLAYIAIKVADTTFRRLL